MRLHTQGRQYIDFDDHYVSTKAKIITIEEYVNKFIESREIMEKINSYKYPASGLIFAGFTEHTINVYKYKSLAGSSYIELPKEHAAKKNGLVNIGNKDDICFK